MLIALAAAAALMFPDVHVRDLDGHATTTRAAIHAPTAILIGFTYGSRQEVEAWEKAIAEDTRSALPAVEMPVYSGLAVFARPMIESGMARHTPKELHPFVWGTSDRAQLVQGLKLDDPDRAAAIVLVDAAGEVRLIERGAPTARARRELLDAWRRMAPASGAP